jgi:hypothetical protein
MNEASHEQLGITNPQLTDALKNFARDAKPENRTALYQALLQSTLILPAPEDEAPAADEALETLEDEPLRFLTYENDAGGIVMIAFTDEDAALTWEPEGLTYLGLQATDLLFIAMENEVAEIVLNPASMESYRLDRGELIALGRGELPLQQSETPPTSTQGLTVLVGAPEEAPPPAWRRALADILKHYLSVEAAYLFELHIPPEGERNVIGLVLYSGMSDDARERIMDALISELEEHLPQEQTLELVVLDEPSFLQTVQDTVPAIYEA